MASGARPGQRPVWCVEQALQVEEVDRETAPARQSHTPPGPFRTRPGGLPPTPGGCDPESAHQWAESAAPTQCLSAPLLSREPSSPPTQPLRSAVTFIYCPSHPPAPAPCVFQVGPGLGLGWKGLQTPLAGPPTCTAVAEGTVLAFSVFVLKWKKPSPEHYPSKLSWAPGEGGGAQSRWEETHQPFPSPPPVAPGAESSTHPSLPPSPGPRSLGGNLALCPFFEPLPRPPCFSPPLPCLWS